MTTSQEHEALVILAEECAEVQKAVAKILRFGWNSRYPANGATNRQKLINELGDVEAATELIEAVQSCGITSNDVAEASARKLRDYASGQYLTMEPPGWLKWHK